MKLPSEIANAIKINIDVQLLHKLSRCVVCAASKENDPCGIGFLRLSSKTTLPHTPRPILIRKSVHKDNEVDASQRRCQLIPDRCSKPGASCRSSCLIDVVNTPLGKGIVDYISDWFVSETVANEDLWFLYA